MDSNDIDAARHRSASGGVAIVHDVHVRLDASGLNRLAVSTHESHGGESS